VTALAPAALRSASATSSSGGGSGSGLRERSLTWMALPALLLSWRSA